MEQVVSHIQTEDLPWVWVDKVGLQVLRYNADTGVWVVRNRFKPGFQLPRHRHTGCVHAYTFSGRWRYAEYGIDYTAGTFIFEPAGSVHTLTVPEDNTEETDIMFVIEGAYVDLDDQGNITGLTDGESVKNAYLALCDAAGIPRPEGILT